jgi:FR47-like protein
MRFVVEPDVYTFELRGLAWMERDPVLNTLPATISRSVMAGLNSGDSAPPVWITIESDDHEPIGAAVRTPPRRMVLPAIGAELARALAGFVFEGSAGKDLPGVNGPVDAAWAFGDRWAELTGCDVRIETDMRLYRLDTLESLTNPGGTWRLATGDDTDLCLGWFQAFATEATRNVPPVERRDVAARVDGRRLGLWQVNGVPVSLAGWTLPASGVVRVGPVYTPPEQRRRGYGAAATAAATAGILDAGAKACLFTDLSNPTSNSIYQKIGYRPVIDCVELDFGRRP